MHPFRLVAALVPLAVVAVSGQSARLGTPTGRLTEEFSDIRGVRELADGRVLISDYIDQRVVIADFAKGTVVSRITNGGGPREIRLPTRLIALPGDTTLVVDLGNNRLLVVDKDGRGISTIPVTQEGLLGTRGVDASGAHYFAIPGWYEQERALPNDSVRIVKWNPRTAAMTNVGVIQGDRMRSDVRSPSMAPRIPTIGYASQDSWVMTDDGVLRIVRGGSYRVESMRPGRPSVVGPSYAYTTPAVTPTDKAAYVHDFAASNPVSGRGEGGGMGQAPMPSDAELARLTRTTEFATHHPMFEAGAVKAAPGGRLWVGRKGSDRRTMLYDIFDDAGRRTGSVMMPPGRKVVSIGKRSVYVIADDDGIQRLERYRLP